MMMMMIMMMMMLSSQVPISRSEVPAWASRGNDYAAPVSQYKAPGGPLTPLTHSWSQRQSQSCAASPRLPPVSRHGGRTPDLRGWGGADLTPSRRGRPATGEQWRKQALLEFLLFVSYSVKIYSLKKRGHDEGNMI